MPFNYDTTGVQESGDFTPIPKGEYVLRIKKTDEKKNKNGDPMVGVQLIVEEGDYKGRSIWHNVSFPEKGAKGSGMAKHWLHAIGQPYEGKVKVDPKEWHGLIRCEVIETEYNGKPKNEISQVHLPEEQQAEEAVAGGEEAEEVPF